MHPFLKIGIILLFLASPFVWADPQSVSLELLVSELLKNNPDIQAAESRYQAALARPGQQRTLPDPVLSFVSRNGSGNPTPFTELGKDPLSSIGVMWTQEFPFPGKLRLAGEIAEKEAAAADAALQSIRWRLISNLKKAYFEYFRSDRSIDVLNDSLELIKHFEEITRARYSVGQGVQQDVLRSQLEISILDQRITKIQQERASAAAEINQLLNRNIDAVLPDPADFPLTNFVLPFETLQTQFAQEAPQIRSAQSMVEREQRSVNLARKQYRPDFMTSVEYANSPNFPDMWSIEIGLRIPVFYKKKQAYGVIEATQNLNRAKQELRSTHQETAFSIKNQYLQIQASEKLLKLYDQAVLPQSKLALESSLSSYQVGKSDFLTTLSNFMTLLEYRMNYYEELTNHEIAIAQLEGVLGQPVGLKTGGSHD